MADFPVFVPSCDEATCETWGELFCICTPQDQLDTVCTPAVVNFVNDPDEDYGVCYPGYNPGFVDNIMNLVGVYSTECTDAGTADSTGADSASWSNIDNAKSDDGSYASITPSPILALSGTFPQTCFQGTQYITLKGFGFNLPPEAIVWGIAIGAKGHATKNQFSAQGFIFPWNVALTVGGVLYYRCDPRTYWIQQKTGIGVFADCSNRLAAEPYPVNCNPHGQQPYFAQPMINRMPGGFVGSEIFTSDEQLASVEYFAGDPGDCTNPLDTSINLSVMQKDMFIPTAKQNWTVDDINAPDFGVAISVYGNNEQTSLALFSTTYFLNCIGIAVYYTLGGGGGGGGGGSISPCPSSTVPTGNPSVRGCGG